MAVRGIDVRTFSRPQLFAERLDRFAGNVPSFPILQMHLINDEQSWFLEVAQVARALPYDDDL